MFTSTKSLGKVLFGLALAFSVGMGSMALAGGDYNNNKYKGYSRHHVHNSHCGHHQPPPKPTPSPSPSPSPSPTCSPVTVIDDTLPAYHPIYASVTSTQVVVEGITLISEDGDSVDVTGFTPQIIDLMTIGNLTTAIRFNLNSVANLPDDNNNSITVAEVQLKITKANAGDKVTFADGGSCELGVPHILHLFTQQAVFVDKVRSGQAVGDYLVSVSFAPLESVQLGCARTACSTDATGLEKWMGSANAVNSEHSGSCDLRCNMGTKRLKINSLIAVRDVG